MHLNGTKSEELAEKYLLERNYTVHFRNKRFGRFEVDLVCQEKDFIVFVEVKSLSSNRFKNPYDSVNASKQKRIIKVADFVIRNYFPDQECRFDVISIVVERGKHHIEHIINAFTPEITNG
jgi:putative endonuclease